MKEIFHIEGETLIFNEGITEINAEDLHNSVQEDETKIPFNVLLSEVLGDEI